MLDDNKPVITECHYHTDKKVINKRYKTIIIHIGMCCFLFVLTLLFMVKSHDDEVVDEPGHGNPTATSEHRHRKNTS